MLKPDARGHDDENVPPFTSKNSFVPLLLKTKPYHSIIQLNITMKFALKATTAMTILPILANSAVIFTDRNWQYPKRIDNIIEHDEAHVEIVGGAPVNPPFKYGNWIVALQKDDYQFCAGSLIGPDILVTAAHCSILGFPLETLRVLAHRHDLSRSTDDEQGVEFKVRKIVANKKFSFSTLQNDVALWFLIGPEDAQLGSISLPESEYSWAGDIATVIGWGATDEGGLASNVLLQVDVPIATNENCKKAVGMNIADSMVCAGGARGKDACQGDSGGPLIAVDKSTGDSVLVGIVSWGKGCARAGFPGVYTRVSSFMQWINEQIELDRLGVDSLPEMLLQ
eukprot:Partr_v1_DN28204_c1_g1_i1_m76265 putative protease